MSVMIILLPTQVSELLGKSLVEEAVLLAETIAAVEASKDSRIADKVKL